MMNKELDFIEWARNSGHGKTQVPMNLLEMILDYQKHVETKFKNLDIQRVMPRLKVETGQEFTHKTKIMKFTENKDGADILNLVGHINIEPNFTVEVNEA